MDETTHPHICPYCRKLIWHDEMVFETVDVEDKKGEKHTAASPFHEECFPKFKAEFGG
jgi:hypothetical protein